MNNSRAGGTANIAPKHRTNAGMSLLVMIALLAIIAMFALVLLRAFIREIDHAVARDETATLKAFHEAFETAILRDSHIPDHTGWTNLIAGNLGAQAQAVAVNRRRQERVLLIDPNCTVTLPYTQTSSGLLLRPANVRMMILSSLGRALPVTSGQVLSPNSFLDLWNAAEGTANFPTTNGWAGLSADVKIQRIDLTPYFLKLYVTTHPAFPEGWFALGTNAAMVAPLNPLPPVRYVLQGTSIKLYHDNGVLDSTQVLNRRASFKYDNRVWKGDPAGAVMPGGIDLAAVVRGFLEAIPNANSRAGQAGLDPSLQQRLVVQSMIDYMKSYNTWAGDFNFQNETLKQHLIDLQSTMIRNVQGLYLYTDGCFPVNPTACP